VIDVIDYGGGNLGSLLRCLERLNVPYQKCSANHLPSGDYPIILPGVGAFGALMNALSQGGLAHRLKQLLQEGVPYLGICVGLQILLESSEESPHSPGLGIVAGSVVKFQAQKVPQIGWNLLKPVSHPNDPEGYVYFVNSYYACPDDSAVVLYEADYNGPFCAAIRQNNLTAFQFHPEKSGPFGHELIKRWLQEVGS